MKPKYRIKYEEENKLYYLQKKTIKSWKNINLDNGRAMAYGDIDTAQKKMAGFIVLDNMWTVVE